MTQESKQSRRQFLKTIGQTTTGLAVASTSITASAEIERKFKIDGKSDFPVKKIELKKNTEVGPVTYFDYPDASSPCVLIKTGTPCPGGVGPKNDVVAYSLLCTHQGYPMSYDSKKRVFKCSRHFSQFDAEMGGQMICGQATVKLPRIILESDADGSNIRAIGIDGLIYGRSTNQLT